MSNNYPPGMNDARFDATIGSREDDDIDSRNEDEVIASRLDAKNFINRLTLNAHPDSILGLMGKMKAASDAMRPIHTNPSTRASIGECTGHNQD